MVSRESAAEGSGTIKAVSEFLFSVKLLFPLCLLQVLALIQFAFTFNAPRPCSRVTSYLHIPEGNSILCSFLFSAITQMSHHSWVVAVPIPGQRKTLNTGFCVSL